MKKVKWEPSRIESQINKITKTVKKRYVPKSAFGNKHILMELNHLRELVDEKTGIDMCRVCDSDGQKEDECDQCYGTGTMEVNCSHESI